MKMHTHQPLTGLVDPALHGADRDPQVIGDLVVLESFVVHEERLSKADLQPTEAFIELGP